MARSGPLADRPGSQSALKNANRRRLIDVVVAEGELTQAQIARRSGLAPATVSNLVRELVGEGVLAAADDAGRRGRTVRLTRTTGVAVGVDFGYRHVTVAVADTSRTILTTRRVDLEIGHDARKGATQARTLLEQAVDEIAVGWDDIIGVGVGLPAPIDSRTRQLGAPSLLPGWVGLHIDDYLTEALGHRVVVENDANLGALAEHLWGAGRGFDSIAYLKLSDGVGAGLVLDGALFRGGLAGTAGEIGHTTVDEYGTVCRCGNRGCLETLVAARVVVGLLEPVLGPDVAVADIVALARQGDAACRRVLADTGRHVGGAVANLCNLLNLERIVVGGELAVAGELLLEPMRDTVARFGIPSAVVTSEIVLGALGPNAHVLGALELVLREHRRA